MEEQIKQLVSIALDELSKVSALSGLNDFNVKYLGKNGSISNLMRGMKDVSAEQRPALGKIINAAREQVEAAAGIKEQELSEKALTEKLMSERIDVTMPAKELGCGNLHPLTIVRNMIVDYFSCNGFEVCNGPEIETDYYNFEALNIPSDHPARDSQDTFFITDNILLRSQTSPVQIRRMESKGPPIKMICPGRVFRADEVDATHSPVFHQLEGLVVDKGITMCDLKGTLESFAQFIFGKKTKTRLRPSFFPFTEPSVEVDASCSQCGGSGCRVCKGTGWIEILGAGMVNRRVLSGCNINPDVYTGFAFGMGLDRITNILFAITDLRVVFENDIRFLKQFK